MTTFTDGPWTLQGQYDDDRRLHIMPSVNAEVVLQIDDGEPMFFFGADLLRLVETAVDEANAAVPR